MRAYSLSAVLMTAIVALATGCQHVPRVPLDLESYAAALAERPMEMTPVQAYAEALAKDRGQAVAEFDIADGVSLQEAEAIALTFNSTVRAARLEVEHAAAVAAASGRWDDPELGLVGGRKRVEGGSRTRELTVEPNLDSPTLASYGFRQEVERSIDKAWVRSASLSITLPISGRLAAERRAHEAGVEAALQRVAEAEWQTLLELRRAWLEWSAAEERTKLLERQMDTLAPFVEAADALRTVGELLSSDARLFAIEQGRLAGQLERTRHEVLALRSGIMRMLGLLPDAPLVLQPSLHIAEAIPAVDDLPGHVARSHPVVARLRAEYEVAEESLRVELRRQYPDLTISPLYTDERDETSLVLGLGFPVPVWNANRLGIAEAAAARDMARARLEHTFEAILSDIAGTQARWEGARAQRIRLAEEVAPMVDAQLKEMEKLLRIGELELPLLHQTLTQSLEIKSELLDAAVSEQLAAATVSAALAPAWPVSAQTVEMQP